MISGTPSSLAMAATSAMGKSRSFGFGSVSPYQARVRSSVARRKFSGSDGSTNCTSMPMVAKVLATRFHEPP
jgi:hypothetical protein